MRGRVQQVIDERLPFLLILTERKYFFKLIDHYHHLSGFQPHQQWLFLPGAAYAGFAFSPSESVAMSGRLVTVYFYELFRQAIQRMLIRLHDANRP